MQRAQADRRIIAARARRFGATRSTEPVSGNLSRPGTNLLARTTPAIAAPGFTGTRRRGNRRPGGDKGQGEWRTVSQNFRTSVTIDARWSATVSTV